MSDSKLVRFAIAPHSVGFCVKTLDACCFQTTGESGCYSVPIIDDRTQYRESRNLKDAINDFHQEANGLPPVAVFRRPEGLSRRILGEVAWGDLRTVLVNWKFEN